MLPRGHGLDNLRARLAALYGDDARLLIDSNGAGTTISIHVPTRHGHTG